MAERDFDPNIKASIERRERWSSVSPPVDPRGPIDDGSATTTGHSRICAATDRTLITESDYTAFTDPVTAMASPVAGGVVPAEWHQ
jgi:hypothetical protein